MPGELLNTKEVARHLGIHEKQVYVLIKARRIPCTRVTGKWVFPRRLIDDWIEANARSGMTRAREKGSRIEGALLAAGSNDPVLDFLQTDLRCRFPGLYLFSTSIGSLEGLRALNLGYTDIAWCHLYDPATKEYNTPYLPRFAPAVRSVVVNLFYRELGFSLPRGNPFKVRGIEDLPKKGVRFINRQKGSGTRLLIDQKLKEKGLSPDQIKGYENEVNTHFEVGLSILNGTANAGITSIAVSRLLGLDFIPLTRERFDMVMDQRTFFGKSSQAFIELLHSGEFRDRVQKVGGYDPSESGRVLYSAN